MDAPDDTLAAWLGWWLDVGCGCGRRVLVPVKLLARGQGQEARLPAVVARMRCRACGGPVASARLVENPQSGAPGYVGGGPAREARVPGWAPTSG